MRILDNFLHFLYIYRLFLVTTIIVIRTFSNYFAKCKLKQNDWLMLYLWYFEFEWGTALAKRVTISGCSQRKRVKYYDCGLV